MNNVEIKGGVIPFISGRAGMTAVFTIPGSREANGVICAYLLALKDYDGALEAKSWFFLLHCRIHCPPSEFQLTGNEEPLIIKAQSLTAWLCAGCFSYTLSPRSPPSPIPSQIPLALGLLP